VFGINKISAGFEVSSAVVMKSCVRRFGGTYPLHVGFEVLTAVVMKSIIFWDMTPCSPFSCIRRFGGTYPLHVGFEVLTAVVMKSIIFWDMTPCSPLSCIRRFGGTYRLHLQGRRISSTNQRASSLQLNGLHGVIFQKMIPLIK
jgi:hypothetical protein